MPHRGLLILMLVAATLAVNAAVLTGLPSDAFPGFALRLALATSQVGLLAIWTGVSRRGMPWRLILLVAGIWAWSACSELQYDFAYPLGCSPRPALAVVLICQAGIVVAILLAMRWCGVHLTRAFEDRGRCGANADARLGQFSVGSILSWMTAGAVLLGLARTLALCGPRISGRDGSIELAAVLGAVSGLVAPAAVWATLGRRQRVTRSVALAAMVWVGAMAWSDQAAAHSPAPPAPICLSVVSLHAALLVASLLVFRVVGYRLERRARPGRDGE